MGVAAAHFDNILKSFAKENHLTNACVLPALADTEPATVLEARIGAGEHQKPLCAAGTCWLEHVLGYFYSASKLLIWQERCSSAGSGVQWVQQSEIAAGGHWWPHRAAGAT